MDPGTTAFILAHLALGEIVLVLALVMAVAGFDDLFIDLVFLGHSASRRLDRAPRPEITSLRALPRALVSNDINAAAVWSAYRRYWIMLDSGDARPWDKTAHRFPASSVS